MTLKKYIWLLSLLPALPAVAQTADDDATLGEVVVTAQRREERLQDVPAAISALSGERLSRQHLLGNADLASQVPSLSFTVQGPGESTLAIRGLGTAYGLAPAVSYYLNETPLDIRTDGMAGAPDIDFFDIERVEVLRGPQGTLYGSSSMGGALRILTAQPDPTGMEVKAEAGLSDMSGGGTGYSGKAALNLPLGDNSAVRFVGAYEHLPGYIDRAAPGDYSDPSPDLQVTKKRANDADIKSGRIIGLWRPTEAISIKPSVYFSEIESGSSSEYFDNLPKYTRAATYASPMISKLVSGNLLVEGDLGFASLLSSSSVLKRDVDNDDDYSLLLVNFAPLFGLPVVDYPTLHRLSSHNEGFIQEFRLTSKSEGRFRWVAGAYYSRFKQHSIELIDSQTFADAFGQTDSTSIYTFDQDLLDRQSAVFADLTYQLLPNLEATVGARYYELKDRLENVQTGVLAAPNQPRVHAKANGTSPRFVLSYRPS